MAKLSYEELIEMQGIRVPFVPQIITPHIEWHLRRGQYENVECDAAKKWIRPGDRVLELGAGLGLVSTVLAQLDHVEEILSIEANPLLIDLIRETHRVNGISKVSLRNGVIAKTTKKQIPFYLRKDFWGSSMDMATGPYEKKVTLPALDLSSLIAEFQPTMIVADIEGAELDIFEDVELGGVRTIVAELHPGAYGVKGQRRILKHLDEQGFRAEREYLRGSVWVLTRKPVAPSPRIYTRGPTPAEHNIENATFVIPTCMKNEGPYLLEWLAYHKSIGIQDFVVFTNDCADGTDLMLDRLDEMGLVTHLPNPAVVANSTYFQPLAMKFAVQMPQVKRADYVIQTDVDEFINIHAGDGQMHDLLKAAGPFHVLSMSEVNFCSSGQWEFKDGWLTEMFDEHETKEPGHWQARRGVKSIIHGLDNFVKFPVHRPGVHPKTHDQLTWLDGSGMPVPEEFMLKQQNGLDRRGRYNLVQIDHHPLRSAQAFLMKKNRGDVVHDGKSVDFHYYRKRAIGGFKEMKISRLLPKARIIWTELMQDQSLAKLHSEAVAFHEERIRLIEHSPEMAELRQWIAEKYFPDRI